MRSRPLAALAVLLFLLLTVRAHALPMAVQSGLPEGITILLDFEDLADLTPITDEYADIGVTMEGATVLSMEGSLNYPHFPPRSGVNVIYDDPGYGGQIAIHFDHARTGDINRIGGYVTGNTNVVMSAYAADNHWLGSDETGGPNYIPVGEPNMLLEVSSPTPIAKVLVYDTGNTFTIDDFFFEGQQFCEIPDVPLYKQSDPDWGNEPYGGTLDSPWQNDDDGDGRFDEDPRDGLDNDHDGKFDEDTPETISKWGCALTSAAMTVSYHGSEQTGFSTTPLVLNNWLRSTPGGYVGGHISWHAVARYARLNGVELYHYESRDRDHGVVNRYLCNQDPVVMFLTASPYTLGHFLLATGRPDESEWNVNDPGGYDLTDLPRDSYSSIRRLSASTTDPAAMTIIVRSPVEILVTDPAGFRTGFDPVSGQYLWEILDSQYYPEVLGAHDGSNGQIQALAFSTGAPLSGDYAVRMTAVGTGGYEISFVGVDQQGDQSLASLSAAIASSVSFTATVSYSSMPGSHIAVTLPPNQAPLADAGGPYETIAGVPLQISAAQSTDPDGTPLVFRWDFDSDGIWDTAWTADSVSTYTYQRPGSYSIRLDVSDGQVTSTASASSTVTGRCYLPAILRAP